MTFITNGILPLITTMSRKILAKLPNKVTYSIFEEIYSIRISNRNWLIVDVGLVSFLVGFDIVRPLDLNQAFTPIF